MNIEEGSDYKKTLVLDSGYALLEGIILLGT